MDEDKKIDTGGLPQTFQRTTTQQPEEYIDKSSKQKDENDRPMAPGDTAGDTPRKSGSQESG